MSQRAQLAIHLDVQYVKVEAIHLESVGVPVITIGVDNIVRASAGLCNEVVEVQIHGYPERALEDVIDPLIARLQELRRDLLVEAATVPVPTDG